MKPECRRRAGQVIGRPLTDAEAAALDRAIIDQMRTLARQDPEGFRALSPAARIERAAESAARAAEARAPRRFAQDADPDETARAARAAWIAEHVVVDRIPGEAVDARQYGFVLADGTRMSASIAPDSDGHANVEWTFLERARHGAPAYEKGEETLTPRQWAEVSEALVAIIEHHIATFDRDSYAFTAYGDAHRRVYSSMARRFDLRGYALFPDGNSFYLLHPEADIGENNELLPRPGRSRRYELGDDIDDAGAFQDDFYRRVDALDRDRASFQRVQAAQRVSRRAAAGQAQGPSEGAAGSGAGGEGLEQGGADGPRGLIEFPRDGAQDALIRLTQAADASTFFHEAGHLILELMGELAARPDAPDALRADYQAALDWLGVRAREDIATPQHERFARGIETYLYEGRAPSPGLASLFRVVADWLRAIYRSVAELDAALTDEVRGVFDRLFAEDSDEPPRSVPGAGERPPIARERPGALRDQQPDPGGPGSPRTGDRSADQAAAGSAASPQRRGPYDAVAIDPELRALREQVDAARAEIDALLAQGRLTPAEAEAARADLEPDARRLQRSEALRAAAFCLEHGSRA